MAEAYLKHFSDGRLTAESAGLEPGTINPYVVDVMREEGIDLSVKTTQSVFELYKQGKQYDAVIAVCSSEANKRCPLFPGRVLRKNWPFPAPSAAAGSEEEKLEYVRKIRDQIKARVKSFAEDFKEKGFKLFLETDN